MLLTARIPLLRLVILFIAGIVLCSYYPANLPITVSGGCLVIVLLILLLLRKAALWHRSAFLHGVFGTSVLLAFAMAGYVLAATHIEQFHHDHFQRVTTGQPQWTVVRIINEPQWRTRSIKIEVEIESIQNHTEWEIRCGKALLYAQPDSSLSLAYGMRMLVKTSWQDIPEPRNPNEFNYKRYLFHHHIYQQGYIPAGSLSVLEQEAGNPLFALAHRLRNYLLSLVREHGITGDEYAVCAALLLGQKDQLDPALIRAYSSAGAMHVLAVSGLHVGIIYLVVHSLLKWMDRDNRFRFLQVGLTIVVIWGYALLTGLSPSVIRAATMFTFVSVGTTFHQYTSVYNTLAVSAFVILLVEPFMIMQVGMQLSYLAVLGIVYLQPKLNRLWHPRTLLLTKAWEITCVSMAAQIATAPLALLYFHQFPTYFLVSNLIVIPAAFLVLFLGIGLFATAGIEPVNRVLAAALHKTVWLLNQAVKQVDQLPASIVGGIDIGTSETWLLYGCLVGFLGWLAYRRSSWLIGSSIGVLVMLTLQVAELAEQRSQSVITFYHVNRHSAVSWIQGDQAYWLADSVLQHDLDKQLFHIRHHWWHRGILTPVVLSDSLQTAHLVKHHGHIVFHGKHLYWLNGDEPLPALSQQLDWLVVSNDQYIPKKWITERHVGQVIIDGSNSYRHAQRLVRFLQQHRIPVVNLKESSGFSIDL